ncbi:MAG: tRNA (guanosine(37)-N1)-methyltransferase TrmD [Henriciella sp.]|jgi:tRNA (guanine37-N1)-methyltransferase|uniref:tRNA (guanosine(37)-N1)-methyltransferase TrmD n=1 Tax=Henriciella sp. TaxID=1968823 RepID=UPI000C10A241|nr:tRNA (guanosine(37)-N1)-methyltransferase TrmD [Henriciella sp.]MAN75075.1 tRNA (guanosine(37)-N1)-methyltransferase TrmD [Henriciella sp.]MBF33728.1 tRNA (guanosine(37)-N1)-methyltransferase TrmD [Hyphomonadaceae bacterium]PHR73153.1 MAG: tRNA (guanosine(37)-N1)-methyltransferase TrmD [Henriciella sp.]|tara:strand:- start:27606 stop:28334 length:729 start_codon:yes stop_codon:yes gene_type:complete
MAFDVSVITLFPEAFPGLLDVSILGRARQQGIWSLETADLRQFGLGRHRQVDDKPAGGGAGLVIRPDVASAAIDSVERAGRPVLYLSPRGEPFSQAMAQEFSAGPGLICFCGRFEGLDERVIAQRGMREVSLGDFVLAGGEAAAQAVIEATVRLLPGVAGNETSIEDESFSAGLLEYPQYTLPRIWENQATPDVLLSGDHEKIAQWRLNRSKLLTEGRRPDLWAAYLNGHRIRASETDDEHD